MLDSPPPDLADPRQDLDFLPAFPPGWVWLAGAGPGAAGLLTIEVFDALGKADVVVYDALVSGEILRLARPGMVMEYVGKRGGAPSCRQADITARLIELAREGRRVLRLKGGDPLVFGRGGEEALGLAAAGIPFRIMPGITAGIGGLAYAGLPATHRGINSAVTFLTGHDSGGHLPDGLDWAALAKGSPVLVVYMGLKHLGDITGQLIAHGRDPDEPVAIVSNATLADQKVLETTVSRAAAEAAAVGMKAPVITVIGRVVELRSQLDWLGRFVHPSAALQAAAPG